MTNSSTTPTKRTKVADPTKELLIAVILLIVAIISALLAGWFTVSMLGNLPDIHEYQHVGLVLFGPLMAAPGCIGAGFTLAIAYIRTQQLKVQKLPEMSQLITGIYTVVKILTIASLIASIVAYVLILTARS